MRLLLLVTLACGTLCAARGGADEAAAAAPAGSAPAAGEQLEASGQLVGDLPAAAGVPAEPSATPEEGAEPSETGPDSEGGSAPEPEGAAPSAAAQPATQPEEPACDPAKGDICLVAEEQGREEGHFWGRGFADLRAGDLQIQTDSLDVRDVKNGDLVEQHLTAEGSVVLLRKNERLVGDRLEMNLSTGRGTMENVVGYVEPGVFFTAHSVDRIDPKTFRMRGVRFTSCCQPNPRWSFAASRATLKVGDHIRAANVRFDLATPGLDAKLPLLYFPYLVYPTKENQRASGLLMPSFNIDTSRGADVRFGLFWAMGRSFDQTFSVERRPQLSYRLGHELRWVLDGGSSGTLTTMIFPPQPGDAPEDRAEKNLPFWNDRWDYSLRWNATQRVPLGFQLKVYADVTSPQDITTSASNYFNSNRNAQFALQRRLGRHNLRLQVVSKAFLREITDTDSGETKLKTTTSRSLPVVSLSQSPTQIGKTGLLFEYAATAEKFSKLVEVEGRDDRLDEYGRLDLAPAVSRPIAWSFLSLRPRAAARYSYYERSNVLDENGNLLPAEGITGDPLHFAYVEGRLDVEGPKLARIFNNPTSLYSDKFKHVFGPEATWILRRSSGEDEKVPRNNLASSLLHAHELQYGLVNQVYGRRKGPAGKPVPFELLTWRIYRKYYVDEPINKRDPAFSSNLVGVADGRIRHSPWRSKLSLKPVPGWSFDWTHEYNMTLNTTTHMDLRATLRGTHGHLTAGWSRRAAYTDESDGFEYPESGFMTGNAELKLWGDRISLGGLANYNVVRKEFLSRSAYVRIKAQCIGILVSMTEQQRRAGQSGGWQFGFAIDLANLTTIGMDPSKPGSRGGMGGAFQ